MLHLVGGGEVAICYIDTLSVNSYCYSTIVGILPLAANAAFRFFAEPKA